MERDRVLRSFHRHNPNFNSHAHVERDIAYFFSCAYSRISTHTLTWSVTNSSQWDYNPVIISTHTLTWSVTFPFNANMKIYIHFNSHAHVERDSSEQSSFIISSNFNSHAHVERDHLSLGNFQPSYISTHTLTWSVT